MPTITYVTSHPALGVPGGSARTIRNGTGTPLSPAETRETRGARAQAREREREWTREKERSFLFFGDWDGDEFESFVWDVFSSMFHPQSLRYIIPSQLTCQSVDT